MCKTEDSQTSTPETSNTLYVNLKKLRGNKCWQGCGEKGNFVHCWWVVYWCSHYGTLWRFLEKLKVELPYDPAIPLLGIYQKKKKKKKERKKEKKK